MIRERHSRPHRCKGTVLVFGLGFCCLGLSLFGFGELGKGELFIETNSKVEYDTNVFLNSDEQGDLSSQASVDLVFEQEKNSVANLKAQAGVEVVRFAELTQQNAENFEAAFDFSYPNNVSRKYFYSLGGRWSDKRRSRPELGERVRSDRLILDGVFMTDIGRKSGLRIKGFQEEEQFSRATLHDSRDYSVDVDFLHRYSEKLNMVWGYRYHDLSYADDLGTRQSGHFLRVGGDGQLTPKVTGLAIGGIQSLNTHFGALENGSETRFFYELDLRWRASDKNTLGVSGGSDFASSPTGEINNRRDLSVSVDRSIGKRGKGRSAFTLIEDSYRGFRSRQERAYRFDAGYSINFSNASTLSLNLQFEDRSSEISSFNYEAMKVGLDFFIMF